MLASTSASTSTFPSISSVNGNLSAGPLNHAEPGAAPRLGTVVIADQMRAGMAERRNSISISSGNKRLKSGVIADHMRETLAQEVANPSGSDKAINQISISTSAATTTSTSVVVEAHRDGPRQPLSAVAALIKVGKINPTEIEEAIKQIEAAKLNLTKDAAEIADWEAALELAEHLRSTLEELDKLFADTKNFDFQTYSEKVRTFKVAYIVLSERLRSIQLLLPNADKLQNTLRPFLFALLAIVAALLLFTKNLPACFDFLNARLEKAQKAIKDAIDFPSKQEILLLVDDTLEIIGKNFLDIERIMKQYGHDKKKGVAVEENGEQQKEAQSIPVKLLSPKRAEQIVEKSKESEQSSLSDKVSARWNVESTEDKQDEQDRSERMKFFLYDVSNERIGKRDISRADQADVPVTSTSSRQRIPKKRTVSSPASFSLQRRDSGYETGDDNPVGGGNNQKSGVNLDQSLKNNKGPSSTESFETPAPDNQRLQRELLAAQRENEQLMQKNSFLEMDWSDLSNSAQRESEQFRQRISSLETNLEALNAQLALTESTKRALEQRIRSTTENEQKLQGQLMSAQHANEQLAKSNSFVEANFEILETQLNIARNKIKKLKETQQEKESEFNEVKVRSALLALKIETLTRDVKALEEINKKQSDEIETLANTLQANNKKLNDKDRWLALVDSEKKALEKQILIGATNEQKLQNELVLAKEKRKKLNELSQKKEIELNEIKERELLLIADKRALEQRVWSYAAEEVALRGKLAQVKSEKEMLKEALQKKEGELSKAYAQVAVLVAKNETLEQRVCSDAAEKFALHDKLAQVKSEKKMLKEALQEKDRELSKADTQAAVQVAKNEALEKQVRDLEIANQPQHNEIEAPKMEEGSTKKKKLSLKKRFITQFLRTNKSKKIEAEPAKESESGPRVPENKIFSGMDEKKSKSKFGLGFYSKSAAGWKGKGKALIRE